MSTRHSETNSRRKTQPMPLTLICFVVFLFGLIPIQMFSQTPPCKQHVDIRIPQGGMPDLTKPIDVYLISDDPNAKGPADIAFTSDANLSVEPSTLHLENGVKGGITLKTTRKDLGIVRLQGIVDSWPGNCRNAIDQALNLGFTHHVVANVSELRADQDAKQDAIPSLDGDEIEPFRIMLRDSDNKPVLLGATITMVLTSDDGLLQDEKSRWSDHATTSIQAGSDSTNIQRFQLPHWGKSKGQIIVHLKVDSSHEDFASYVLTFNSTDVWWIDLIAMVLGAFLYNLAEALFNSPKDLRKAAGVFVEGRGAKIAVTAMVALLAFVFRHTDVLGIKGRTSTFMECVLYGFLASVLGLEGLFKRFRNDRPGGQGDPNAPAK